MAWGWTQIKPWAWRRLDKLMAARMPRPEMVEPEREPVAPMEMPAVVRPDLVQVPSDQYQHLLEMSLSRPTVTWQGVLAGFCLCLLLVVVVVVLVAVYAILEAVVVAG